MFSSLLRLGREGAGGAAASDGSAPRQLPVGRPAAAAASINGPGGKQQQHQQHLSRGGRGGGGSLE